MPLACFFTAATILGQPGKIGNANTNLTTSVVRFFLLPECFILCYILHTIITMIINGSYPKTVPQKYGFLCFSSNAEIAGKVRYYPGIINGSCWSLMYKNTGMNRPDPNNLKIHRFKTNYPQSDSQPDSPIPPAIKCNPHE